MKRHRTSDSGVATAQRGNGSSALTRPGRRTGEIQAFDTVKQMPLGLDEETCQASVRLLNPLLADTMTLRDLYKKHHWQVSGPTFYQLHLLYDKHFGEQQEIVDEIAERIQMLGGISVAMAHDVIELARIERPPQGREAPVAQLARLLEAHELVLRDARRVASETSDHGDEGSNDLIVSQVIRTNEMQVWFLNEHLAEVSLTDQSAQEED